jgi:ABC-type bacteriocin/lantibiotic exporter with double-glycine peptidase domain
MDTLQRGERPTLPGMTEQTRKALHTLRSPIVGVSHKDPVFFASILANITLFEPTTDQTLLDRALELSQLRQWTDQLPMGIHEMINTQSWQFHPQFRLALLLARGLHQKPLSLLITLPEALTRDRSLNNILKRIHTAGVTILILKQ